MTCEVVRDLQKNMEIPNRMIDFDINLKYKNNMSNKQHI